MSGIYFKRIAIAFGNDGYEYIIPFEELNNFYTFFDNINKRLIGEEKLRKEFNKKYSKYRVEGDINNYNRPLYILEEK